VGEGTDGQASAKLRVPRVAPTC